MKDDSVVDLFNNIDKIKKQEDLINHVTPTNMDGQEIKLLSSSILFNEEHELADIVEELELNLSFFLFNDDSTVNQTIKNKLLKLNISLIKLKNDSYCLNFGNFCINFSL